ncbi:MAG: hypothetical protein ACK4HF_17010 [Paracoccaceae bacterium]
MRGPDADVVLGIDSASGRSLFARIDWRGHPPGELRGIARRDADLDDMARSTLLDALLETSRR